MSNPSLFIYKVRADHYGYSGRSHTAMEVIVATNEEKMSCAEEAWKLLPYSKNRRIVNIEFLFRVEATNFTMERGK